MIRWIDDTGFQSLPVASYGAVLVMAAASYLLLEWAIIACNGPDSPLAAAIGSRRKEFVSLAAYLMGIALAFWQPWAAIAVYVMISAAWFLPDRRIEMLKSARRT